MRKNYVLFLCICSASLFFSTLGVRAGQVNEDLQMETEVQEQEYNGFHKQMKVTGEITITRASVEDELIE